MSDLDLWHLKEPVSPARLASILVLLLEVPRRKVDAFEVLARLNGDKLAEILALLLDYPVEWVRRNYSARGASQVIGEFLWQHDLRTQLREMRKNTKAATILREAANGR